MGGRGLYLVIGVVFVAIMFGVWKGIDSLITADPDPDEHGYPTITDSEARSFERGLRDGATKQDVFARVGRGEFDTETKPNIRTGRSEECYLWRVKGSEANSSGHFPLWELCFDSDTHRLVGRGGRFQEE